MKKILLSGLIGGIILTIWAVLSWMILPFHEETIKPMPNAEQVSTILEYSIDKQGVYMLPSYPQDLKGAELDSAMKLWEEKYNAGPIATVFYQPEGGDPMMTIQFIYGLIINIISAMLAAWFLSRSTAAAQSYIARVSFVALLAVFASVAIHLIEWNWMLFPFKYTTAMIVDLVIGWIFVGLVIGAIIKQPKEG